MFMMSDIDLDDAKEAYRFIEEKIKDVEKEISQLQKEKLHYFKCQAEVAKKLDKLCEHDWFKIASHQFSPLECKKCGLIYDRF